MFPATSMPDADWWSTLWPNPAETIRATIESTTVNDSSNILDLCCGNGYFTCPMTQLTKTGKVVGIELDATLLEEAQNAAAGALEAGDRSKIAFLQGDAMQLTQICGDTTFDLIFLANTFHGIPDKLEMLRQMKAVLSDSTNAEIVIVNWRTDIPRDRCIVLDKPRGPADSLRISAETVSRIATEAGLFTKRVIDSVSPFHYAVVLSKSPTL